MPDPYSSSTEPPHKPLWRVLKNFLLGRNGDSSLRESIEEALDEHDAGAQDDLSPVERTMLKNLLHFGERTADDAAVPRADIIGFESSGSFQQLVALFAEAGHSRVPVYQDDLDHVIGMVHVKDVYARLATQGRASDVAVAELLRPVLFVPQAMRTLDLLARMRSQRTHMAIVIDEFGGTDGLVTIEDLVEEIVGEIEDEHDEEVTRMIIALPDNGYEADARVEVGELETLLGVSLADPEEDIDTLGGIVFMLAGRVPSVGEVVAHQSGWRFEVIAGDARKIDRLRLHPPETAPAPDDEAEDGAQKQS